MNAADLQRWLRALHPVPEPSVDRVIVGDPATRVAAIAVMWMPTWAALREAASRGANVVVAHEPTFFAHLDLADTEQPEPDIPREGRAVFDVTITEKRRWIEAQRLVVIRCHDVLDEIPGGVVDTLAQQLGFSRSDYVREWKRYRVVRLPDPVAAAHVAQRLANAFAALNQPGVGFYGDANRVVRTLGLGTGYGCEPWRFADLGADMGLTIDDRLKTWRDGEWADDAGYPLAVINHGTSEEWGVRRLAELITGAHPEMRVTVVKQGCSHRWFSAQE